MSKTVLLIGTLDTKGREYAYVRDLIAAAGSRRSCSTPASWASPCSRPTARPCAPPRPAAARSPSCARSAIEATPSRSWAWGRAPSPSSCSPRASSTASSAWAAPAARRSATTAMQALPVGMPKVIVSTMASGDVASYVDVKDITMMYSVVDVAGLNRLSRRILANAAGAICRHGRAGDADGRGEAARSARRCSASRRRASTASASGWRRAATRCSSSTPSAAAAGRWRRSSPTASSPASADITTTEWCDELVGGVLLGRAGPPRRAGPSGHPAGRLARRARHGQLRAHATRCRRSSRTATSTSTTRRSPSCARRPRSARELGEIIAEKLNEATGPDRAVPPAARASA